MKCLPIRSKTQSGFTAIELLIVIVVGLVIAAVAGGRIAGLFGKSDEATESGNYQSLIAAAKSLRTNQGYGTTGTNLVPSMIAIKAIPSLMTVSAGKLYNTWNGEVTLVSTGIGYTVSTAGLPSDMCIKIAKGMSGSGSIVKTTINGGAAINGQVDVATATTQCSTETNLLTWTVSS